MITQTRIRELEAEAEDVPMIGTMARIGIAWAATGRARRALDPRRLGHQRRRCDMPSTIEMRSGRAARRTRSTAAPAERRGDVHLPSGCGRCAGSCRRRPRAAAGMRKLGLSKTCSRPQWCMKYQRPMNTPNADDRADESIQTSGAAIGLDHRLVGDGDRRSSASTWPSVAASLAATWCDVLVVMRALPAARGCTSPDSSREAGVEAQVGRAGVRERHVERGHDAARAGRHHEHARRQEDRLDDRVGDEQRAEALALEQREQLVVEALAGDLVEGAERLVEQEHVGSITSDGPARPASACRRRAVWGTCPRTRRARRARSFSATRRVAVRLAKPVELGEQLDVAAHRAPLQQRGVLEHVAQAAPVDGDRSRVVARRARRRSAAASTCRSPTARRS